MTFLSPCSSGDVRFLPHSGRIVLLDIGLLIDYFFSFSALNGSSHCLLASKGTFLRILCAMSCFSFATFKIISLSSSLKSLLCVLVCVSLSSSYFEFVELLQCLYSCLSPNLGSVPLCYLKYSLFPFFSSPPGIPTVRISVNLRVSHRPLGLGSLFFNLFFQYLLA